MARATETPYQLRTMLDVPFEEADRRVRDALAAEGFGILTEIDVRETLREKLEVEFRPYRILGACNPPLAHRALEAETEIGLLLPCNVIVYEGETSEESVVAALDPVVQLELTGREDLRPLAEEVRERVERALRSLAGAGA